MLAEHGLRTTTGQADQAAERLGILRRAQQRHQGWLEAHDADLRLQERAVAREDAWRRRVDQHAVALDPPGWLLAELGPVPTDPGERAVWRGAAAELDGYRRAYGLDHPTAGEAWWGGGWPETGGRRAPATPLAGEAADGARKRPGHRRHDERSHYQGGRASRRTAADQRPPGRPWAGCWAPNHAATPPAAAATGTAPGRPWSAWPTTTATVTTATARRSGPAG